MPVFVVVTLQTFRLHFPLWIRAIARYFMQLLIAFGVECCKCVKLLHNICKCICKYILTVSLKILIHIHIQVLLFNFLLFKCTWVFFCINCHYALPPAYTVLTSDYIFVCKFMQMWVCMQIFCILVHFFHYYLINWLINIKMAGYFREAKVKFRKDENFFIGVYIK